MEDWYGGVRGKLEVFLGPAVFWEEWRGGEGRGAGLEFHPLMYAGGGGFRSGG